MMLHYALTQFTHIIVLPSMVSREIMPTAGGNFEYEIKLFFFIVAASN